MRYQAFDPSRQFLDIRPNGDAVAHQNNSEFWPSLIEGRIELEGSLFCVLTFGGDWSHWERHPAGDELLLLQTGAAEIELESEAGRVETIRLNRDTPAFLVPRGIWHRVRAEQDSRIAFLTPGENTEHR